MSGPAEAQPAAAGHPGAHPYGFEGHYWSGRHFGPPLPLKILGVVVAFWIFKPLGVAALAFLIWRSVRGAGGCGFPREGVDRGMARGPWAGRGPTPATRNGAFEERRQATLRQLDEEAKAFDEFERRRREAEDKQAFDRFMANRNPPQNPEEPRS
jgi:hypothetical protein